MVFVGLSQDDADELIAELDHNDHGFTALGERIKARIEGHRTFLKAVTAGDDDLIAAADRSMLELYPEK